jgi:DNA-directed RNA polymerase subunit P
MINMVEENSDSVQETTVEETPAEETPAEIFDVIYSCLRCATNVSNTELSRLPEIKCICGFRVFTKVRPPVVKTIKAI